MSRPAPGRYIGIFLAEQGPERAVAQGASGPLWVRVSGSPWLLVHVVVVRAGCEDTGIGAAVAVKLGVARPEIEPVDPVGLGDDMHR
jgi:hypothetical protein